MIATLTNVLGVALAASTVAGFSAAASAADITVERSKTGDPVIVMSGRIKRGDAARLKVAWPTLPKPTAKPDDSADPFETKGTFTATSPAAASSSLTSVRAKPVRVPVIFVRLESDGGDVEEAVRAAQVVWRRGAATLVPAGKRCLGACALIFMAGSKTLPDGTRLPDRRLHTGGLLGFHAPFMPGKFSTLGEGERINTQAAFAALGAFQQLQSTLPWPRSLSRALLAAKRDTLLYVDTLDQAGRWQIQLEGVGGRVILEAPSTLRLCRNMHRWREAGPSAAATLERAPVMAGAKVSKNGGGTHRFTFPGDGRRALACTVTFKDNAFSYTLGKAATASRPAPAWAMMRANTTLASLRLRGQPVAERPAVLPKALAAWSPKPTVAVTPVYVPSTTRPSEAPAARRPTRANPSSVVRPGADVSGDDLDTRRRRPPGRTARVVPPSPPPTPTPPPRTLRGGLWDHNGSTVRITLSGNSLIIRYARPRRGMRRQGARRGTLLFNGTLDASGNVTGTARIFRRGCRPAPYQVRGTFRIGSGSLLLLGRGATFVRGCYHTLRARYGVRSGRLYFGRIN
ncbi:MAG: hypothetical protein AAFR04_12925 [Pseudomonadota bacterium]